MVSPVRWPVIDRSNCRDPKDRSRSLSYVIDSISTYMCVLYFFICTYIHTYIHPSMHPCIHACIHPSIHASMHAHIFFKYLYMCVKGFFWGKQDLRHMKHIYIYTYIYICIYIYLNKNKLIDIYIYKYVYIYIYMLQPLNSQSWKSTSVPHSIKDLVRQENRKLGEETASDSPGT